MATRDRPDLTLAGALGPGARLVALAAAAALAAGCLISPKPEPPLVTLEPGLVLSAGVTGPADPNLLGEPGAAGPPGATVRAYDLDNEELAGEGVVREDGSFGLLVTAASEGDEVRLQVVSTEGRSGPVDLVLGPPLSRPVLAERPLGHCLLLDPPLELDLGASRALVVRNRCDRAVVVEEPTIRRPVAGMGVGAGASWPASVAPGGSVEVLLEVEPGSAVEEVLLVQVSAPDRDRRPVTLLPP